MECEVFAECFKAAKVFRIVILGPCKFIFSSLSHFFYPSGRSLGLADSFNFLLEVIKGDIGEFSGVVFANHFRIAMIIRGREPISRNPASIDGREIT